MNYTSRILQFIPEGLMKELYKIAMDVLIPDNNTKVNKMVASLDKWNVPYEEIAPGTNRFAILIDGYVFKIGMDKAGIRDNWAELSLTQELQPFVTKVYECNGLINVSEYVTVISKEEFNNSKEEVREILGHLAQGYLLGDVGSINKNFMNWGYRDDGQLVILDFAYIYRVIGNEMMCQGLNHDDTLCKEFLEYDENFHNLICPKCRKKYTFHDIRRRINMEFEQKELEMIKQVAVKVTEPNTEVNNKNKQKNKNNSVEENDKGDEQDMGKKKHKKKCNIVNVETEIDPMELFNKAVEDVYNMYKTSKQYESDDGTGTIERDISDDVYIDKDKGKDANVILQVPKSREGLGNYHTQVVYDIDNGTVKDVNVPPNLNKDFDGDVYTIGEDCNYPDDSNDIEEDENDTDGITVNVCDIDSPVDNPTLISDNVEISHYDSTPIHVTEDVVGVEDIEGTNLIESNEVLDIDNDDERDFNPFGGSIVFSHDNEDDTTSDDINVEQGCDVPDEKATEGLMIFKPDDDYNIKENTSTLQSYGGILSFGNSSNIDDMRNELMSDVDEESYDEYDELYEDVIRTNQHLKYNKKNKRNF